MEKVAFIAILALVCLSVTAAQTSGEGALQSQSATSSPSADVPAAATTPIVGDTTPPVAPPKIINETTKNPTPTPTPGAAIPISTVISGTPFSVSLLYAVNYTAEQKVVMSSAAGGIPGTYSATIPAGITPPGTMIRWAVLVTLPDGSTSRDPVFKDANSTQYYGAILPNPATAQPVPILEWYTQDPSGSQDQSGAPGSIYFGNKFYDNIHIGRKGVTSLSWPKAKLKFKFHKINKFTYDVNRKPVKKIDVNSDWHEPGDNSYLREFVAYNVFRTSGVPVPEIFPIVINLNNAFFGFFHMKSSIDADFLQYNNYSPTGDLFKALDGTNSNLRYDVPLDQLKYYYKLEGAGNMTDNAKDLAAYRRLKDFQVSISGGGVQTRSKYAMDHLNVPMVVDEMAAQAMMLEQDRLTKNYFIYRSDKTDEWTRFPWDVKSTFATDRGLGGQPSPDYCILACSQWNSPLYGDSDHPQDLGGTTPWSIITPSFGTYSGSGRKMLAHVFKNVKAGRKLSQAEVAAPAPNGPGGTQEGVDINRSAVASQQGPNGTFNYLIDLVLDVPATRAMYLRRLRTLMDFWLNGRIAQDFNTAFTPIQAILAQDNAVWKGGDPDLGLKQMLTETLPTRKAQLYSYYGPGGPIPLIPAAQANGAPLSIGTVEPSPSNPLEGYIQLVNPNTFAIDVSNYKVSGGAGGPQITLAPGSVIPALPNEPYLYLSPDVTAFRSRPTTPTKNEGHFVQGPLMGAIGAGATITVTDAQGNAVPLTPAPAATPAASPAMPADSVLQSAAG